MDFVLSSDKDGMSSFQIWGEQPSKAVSFSIDGKEYVVEIPCFFRYLSVVAEVKEDGIVYFVIAFKFPEDGSHLLFGRCYSSPQNALISALANEGR